MILIADDDLDFAETCLMMLEWHGYKATVASNGLEALTKIQEQQPELLISDCSMPHITGLQLSSEVRTRPAGHQFPILLMSGSLRCQVAPGTSYDGFLRKPFMAEDLMCAVRKLLANYTGAVSSDKGSA